MQAGLLYARVAGKAWTCVTRTFRGFFLASGFWQVHRRSQSWYRRWMGGTYVRPLSTHGAALACGLVWRNFRGDDVPAQARFDEHACLPAGGSAARNKKKIEKNRMWLVGAVLGGPRRAEECRPCIPNNNSRTGLDWTRAGFSSLVGVVSLALEIPDVMLRSKLSSMQLLHSL